MKGPGTLVSHSKTLLRSSLFTRWCLLLSCLSWLCFSPLSPFPALPAFCQDPPGLRVAVAATAAKSLQSCPTLCNPINGSPPGSPVPGTLQAKNTGVGCHCLLQCMKMKSESEVAQLCPTLHDPMDCSLPGSSINGILQARVLEWGAIAFSDTHTKLL